MQGLHLTADLYGCRCDPALLTRADALSELCRQAVASAALRCVGDRFIAFPGSAEQPGGVTGAVLLAESHVAVHTWPERAGVTLDVYVCNYTTDNCAKAENLLHTLLAGFDPASRHCRRIMRGTVAAAGGAHSDDALPRPDGDLLLEWHNRDSAYGYRAGRLLETVRSRYQTIEVYDTAQFGKSFRLDGSFMTSERDEFFYHEALVHPAAIAHPAPRSALIVGGGDGGSAEELLKHPSIERIVIAELDAEVIGIARRHLQSVHRGAFDDPRVRIRIGDGAAQVRDDPDRYDLVLLDLTDPDTPADHLYREPFFAAVRERLAPGGAMTLHLGSPVFSPQRVGTLLQRLRAQFPQVHPLGLYVPLYGAYWGMAVASAQMDPTAITAGEVARRLDARGIDALSYYNDRIHGALFALPNFYRRLDPAAGTSA